MFKQIWKQKKQNNIIVIAENNDVLQDILV